MDHSRGPDSYGIFLEPRTPAGDRERPLLPLHPLGEAPESAFSGVEGE